MMNRLIGLLLLLSFCFFWSCQKEMSFETGKGPSSGSLQSDVTGDCLPKTVAGTYEAGKALVGDSNYIQVQVNVAETGTYVITTDTANGMHFSASGVFTTPGLVTVKLKGSGTPITDGISNFIVVYDTTICFVAVTVLPGGGAVPAEFTFEGAPGSCMNYMVSGTYVVGTPLDPLSNTVSISVNVTAAGTYTISTPVSNGMSFSSTGTLATGSQTIVLSGSGTPSATGDANFPISATGIVSSCSFVVTVTGPAVYTVDCTGATVNGTYEERTALAGANTIVIPVNVTTAGSYSITGTIDGMTFTSTGSFPMTGVQNVTLNGTGTPTDPGTFNVPLTANGTAACNVSITVTPVDYFPRTVGSNWSHEFGGVATDSLLTIATNFPPRVVGGNSFAIFARTPDATLGFDTSNYFRKAAGTYYRWQNLRYYLGFDVAQFAEFIFLKDDQAVGHTWTTAAYSGTITDPSDGTVYNVSVRITFKILEKDVSVTVKGVPYPNTIRLKESYEINVNGGGWVDGTSFYGYYEDYYSRNIGWIMDKSFDENAAEDPASRMELRRYQVN